MKHNEDCFILKKLRKGHKKSNVSLFVMRKKPTIYQQVKDNHFLLVKLGITDKMIVDLYKTNKTLATIANELGISAGLLGQRIKELNLKRTKRFQKKAYNKKKIQELDRLGLSQVQIAKKLGIGTTTLTRIRKFYHIELPKQRLYSKKNIESRTYYKLHHILPESPYQTNILEKYAKQIIELLKQGVSRTEIAKRYNVCTATVFNFMYLYGLHEPVKKKCWNKKEFKKLYKSGLSQKEIAKHLNCAPCTVSHKVKEFGLKRSASKVKKGSKLNIQENLIKKLYMQGLSGQEIANQVHATNISVYNKIHQMKLTRPKKWAEYTSTFKGHDEELLQMRQRGMTLKEIGQKFGVKANTVHHRLKKLEAKYA